MRVVNDGLPRHSDRCHLKLPPNPLWWIWWKQQRWLQDEARGRGTTWGVVGTSCWTGGRGVTCYNLIPTSIIVNKFRIRKSLGGMYGKKYMPPPHTPCITSTLEKANVIINVIRSHVRMVENFMCQLWSITPSPLSFWDDINYIFIAVGEDTHLMILLRRVALYIMTTKTTSSGTLWHGMARRGAYLCRSYVGNGEGGEKRFRGGIFGESIVLMVAVPFPLFSCPLKIINGNCEVCMKEIYQRCKGKSILNSWVEVVEGRFPNISMQGYIIYLFSYIFHVHEIYEFFLKEILQENQSVLTISII